MKHRVQKETRKAHWDYVGQILQDSLDNKETKTFWKYIKSKKQENMGVQPLKNKGKLESDDKIKAELLIEQFKSVFSSDTISDGDVITPAFPYIGRVSISESGDTKLLENLIVNSAAGPDAIPNRILKAAAPVNYPMIG